MLTIVILHHLIIIFRVIVEIGVLQVENNITPRLNFTHFCMESTRYNVCYLTFQTCWTHFFGFLGVVDLGYRRYVKGYVLNIVVDIFLLVISRFAIFIY